MQIGIPQITQEKLCQYQTTRLMTQCWVQYSNTCKQEGILRAIDFCVLIHHRYGNSSTVEARGVLWRSRWFPSTAAYCTHVLHREVLQELHAGLSGSHLGEEQTFKWLMERFYWPIQWEDTQNWCQMCNTCTRRKSPTPKQKGSLGSITSGCINASGCNRCCWTSKEGNVGNVYLLVLTDHCSDHCSKWAVAYVIPNQEAITVAQMSFSAAS